MAHKEAVRKGAPKVKHLGRSGPRTQRYLENYYTRVYPRRKLRRILRNNGLQAARKWAREWHHDAIFHEVASKLGYL